MNGSAPPPPPPHGEKPHTTHGEYRNASDLPEGNYDIFIVPPHASGAGFLYLPSLQCHRNSFLAGSASTLLVVLVWVNLSPVFKAWYTLTIAVGGGGGGASVWGMVLLGIVSGLVGWGMGLWQADGGSTWRDTWSRGKSGGSGSRGPGAGGSHTKGSSSGDSGYGTGANTGSRPNSSNQRKGPDNSGWRKAREEEQKEEERAREEEQQKEKERAREEARKRDEIRAREEKARQEKKRRDEEKAKDEARKRQEAKAREEARRKEEERAREENKRREELRQKMDEFKRKRDEETREKQRQRDHEAMERELRERKEQFEKEMAAAREAAAKEARERAEKEAAEARTKVEREAAAARAKAEKEAAERRQRAEKEKAEKDAAEAKAREEKEAAEKEAAAKAAAKKEADAKFAALKEAAAKRYAEKKAKDAEEAAAKEATAKEDAAKGAAPPPRSPSPQKQATGHPNDTYKPYERVRRPYGGASGHSGSSAPSESSYAASQSTARTSPPPSHHGFSSKDRDGYSTKDPDKIVISAVFAFNNNFVQTPVAQLVSGQGMVTDGLVLRITTEGLFIDDDIRGIPQREWDVKAWTMHMVEVWCPQYASAPQAREEPTKSSNPFRRGPPPGPTPEESDAYLMNLLKVCKNRCRLSSPGNKGDNVLGFEHQGLHILRAHFRDQDGKKYVFVLDETEGWKVAIGLQRLRRGTQVRALGVASMSVNDSNFLLENLGYIY